MSIEVTSEQAELIIADLVKALTHIEALVNEASTRPRAMWTVSSAALIGEACGETARTALSKLKKEEWFNEET